MYPIFSKIVLSLPWYSSYVTDLYHRSEDVTEPAHITSSRTSVDKYFWWGIHGHITFCAITSLKLCQHENEWHKLIRVPSKYLSLSRKVSVTHYTYIDISAWRKIVRKFLLKRNLHGKVAMNSMPKNVQRIMLFEKRHHLWSRMFRLSGSSPSSRTSISFSIFWSCSKTALFKGSILGLHSTSARPPL